jgi:ABC-type phosphonate transport system ATPase subunit
VCCTRVFVARYMNCAEYDTTRRRKVMVNATTRLLALEARHEDDTRRFRDDGKGKMSEDYVTTKRRASPPSAASLYVSTLNSRTQLITTPREIFVDRPTLGVKQNDEARMKKNLKERF